MTDKIERQNLTVEDAKAAVPGLHFIYDGDVACLDCYDAAKLLTWLNGRAIDIHYLSSPIQRGKLRPIRFGTRNMYPFDELKLLVVRQTRGRPAESRLSKEAKDAISEGQKRRWAGVKEQESLAQS